MDIPSDDVLLRDATGADAAGLAAVYAHYVEHSVATFDLEAPPEEHWTRRLQELTTAGLPALVAARAGRVVGFAYLSPFRPKPAYRRTLEDTVYLAPGATGRGIGTMLLAELVVRAERTDAHQLVAVISTGEDGPSARLHRALGFETAGRLREVGHKFGRWIDVVLMQRRVGDD
jgi:phosphinothricin acetyltransferase